MQWYLSVGLSQDSSKPAAIGLLLWARWGKIYRSITAQPALSSSGVLRENAGSATLSAYVGSRT